MEGQSKAESSALSGMSKSALQASALQGMEGKNAEGGITGNVKESFVFPLIAETNRTTKEHYIVSYIVFFFVVLQILFSTLYNGRDSDPPVINYFKAVFSIGLIGYTFDYRLGFTVIIVINLILILIFGIIMLDFSLNHEFKTASKYIFRYCHGCFLMIMVCPNFLLIGYSLSELGNSGGIINIVLVIISILSGIILFIMAKTLTIPLLMTPYMIENSVFLFNPEDVVVNFFLFGIPIALYQFFHFYPRWHDIFSFVLYALFFFFLWRTGHYLQLRSKVANAAIESLSITCLISSVIVFANGFVVVPFYILYGAPFALLIILTIVFFFINKFRIKKMAAQLAYSNLERGKNSVDQEKKDYLATLGIKNRMQAIAYMIVGLENYSELFLDWSLSRFLATEFPEDNRLLIFHAWFVSFFPSETLTLHTFIGLVQKMIEPNFTDSVMRFQLHRIHIFRQSSASKEANADFAKVRRLTDAAIAENCKFFTNAANPHGEMSTDVFAKATTARKIAEAGWTEILDKYPNNARFANEYSRFLLDGLCSFKDSIRWHIRANQIEGGNRHENDRMFKRFVVAYPYYLKLNVVDSRGNLRLQQLASAREVAGEDGSISISTTTQSSSTGASSTQGDSDSDQDALDMVEAEKFLPQAQLRLAFEQAANALRSPTIGKINISSIVRLTLSIVFATVVFSLLFPLFDDQTAQFDELFLFNMVEHRLLMTASQEHWMLVAAVDPTYDPKKVMEIFGPSANLIMDFTNREQELGPRIHNLSVLTSSSMNEFATRIFLKPSGTSREQLLATWITGTEMNGTTCYKTGSKLRSIVVENVTATDGAIRNLLSQLMRIAGISDHTKLLESPEYCEIVTNIFTITNRLDEIVRVFVPYYNAEIQNYESTGKSFYLGDDVEAAEPSEEMISESASSSDATQITNFMIAFTPFILLFLAMPSIMYLSAGLDDEQKSMSRLLMSFPRDQCLIAAQPIQRTIQGNGQRTLVSSNNEKTQIPSWIFNLVSCIIVIGLLLALVLVTEYQYSRADDIINQFTLVMEHRNSLLEANLRLQKLILLHNIQYNDVYKTLGMPSYLNKDDLVEGLKKAIARASIIQGMLDIGTETMSSSIGFSDAIDVVRFEQFCEFLTNSTYILDFYRCVSLDRSNAFFLERIKSISAQILASTSLSVKPLDEDPLHIAMLVNTRIGTGQEELAKGGYRKAYQDLLNDFHILAILCYVLSLVFIITAFVVELLVASSIKDLLASFRSIMLRLPPIAFVSHQQAVAFLIGKDSSGDTTIISASHAVFHTSGDAMILLNEDQIIETLNPAATTIFGFTPEQMLGQGLHALIPKKDSSQANQQLYYTMQLMRSGQCGLVYEAQVSGLKDDGSDVPLKVTLLGFSSNGRIAESFAMMCKDQTEELRQKVAVEAAKKQSDELLLKILPPDIIRRLNRGEKDITMVVPSATIIFIDIVQFSAYMSTLTAAQIMASLGAVFTAFDKIAAELPMITKIKLIGDVYMAAGGLFNPDEPPKTHAVQMIQFAQRALAAIDHLNEELNANLMVRIGINTNGPIIAGVLGTDKPLFDIIGDPINVASRLQSTDIPGMIQISQATYDLVAGESQFHIEQRGEIWLKGKGNQMTYLVHPLEPVSGRE